MAKISIRNVDPEIYWDARIYAVQTGQTMGELVSTALESLISEDVEMSEEERFTDQHWQSEIEAVA